MFIDDIYLYVSYKCTGLPFLYVYGVAADVLIALRAYLTSTAVIPILRHGSRRVGIPAARKPLTAVKAATASHSNYYFTNPGHTHYQTLPVHTWRIAVFPPFCSTNSPCGTVAILCYLSSRWQPTSASSRFSLSNHFPSSSGSPSHTVHLRVLPPTQLRRRGAIRYPVYIYHSSDTPTFGCSTPAHP
jgi:hypothetical protein